MDFNEIINSTWLNKVMPYLLSRLGIIARLIAGYVMAHLAIVHLDTALTSTQQSSFNDWMIASLTTAGTVALGWLSVWVQGHQKQGVAVLQALLNKIMANPVSQFAVPDAAKSSFGVIPLKQDGIAGNKTVTVAAAITNVTPSEVKQIAANNK